MTKEEAQALLDEVRANHTRLASCAGPHQFEPCEWYGNTKEVARRHKCALCGGLLDSTHVTWYQRGLVDGVKAMTERTK